MATTIAGVLDAYTIPECANEWDSYLRQFLGVDCKLALDGALPPVGVLIAAAAVDALLQPGMVDPGPGGTTSPNVFELIQSTVIPLWTLATFPGAVGITIVSTTGLSLNSYVINTFSGITEQTIEMLDVALKAWFVSIEVAYTLAGLPHFYLFVEV